MNIRFEKSFLKDVKKRKDKTLKERIESVITEIKRAEERSDLTNIEKLKGHDSAYKIRIGDYRMGLFIENDTIIFLSCARRERLKIGFLKISNLSICISGFGSCGVFFRHVYSIKQEL